MNSKFLESRNILLRALSSTDDLSNYESWLNDQEITMYMGSGKFPSTVDSLKEYIMKYNSSKEGMLLGIFPKENQKHIGNITLHMIDWIHRKAEIGIIIGDKNDFKKGYGTEAVNLLLKHGFERLNLHKITAGMVSLNNGSVKLFEKCGFEIEGTLKQDFYFENNYYDTFRYGILKESYTKEINK